MTDRLIQQALLQVLQPILDPTVSEHSYGFRPGRRAHDAVLTAQSYVQSGRRIRAYLNSGIMSDGVVRERYQGTPQGGPLSPLLANVMLDEVDKELWSGAGIVSCALLTTATCMCAVKRRVNG